MSNLQNLVCRYYKLVGEVRSNEQLAIESRQWCRPEDAERQTTAANECRAEAEKALVELRELAPTIDEVFSLACELDSAGQTLETREFVWAVSSACFRGDAKVPPHARKHFYGLPFCEENQERAANHPANN